MREFHQVTTIFPLMTSQEFDRLKEDIHANGLLEPIWLDGLGKIIDGRNRERACADLGIDPKYQHYYGDPDDLVAFVVSLNLHRRHLDEGQRAMVATRLATLKREDMLKQNVTDAQICATTQQEAADLLNISRRSVQQARKVIDHGTLELQQAVMDGNTSVSAASDISTLPASEQSEIVAHGEKAILKAAKEIRAAKRQEPKKNTPPPALPQGEYDVILADPPWRYDFSETNKRAIENQYPTMTLEEIKDIDAPSADDAVLFLWATAPKLLDAMEVLYEWGFRYVTCAMWNKEIFGMGYWFRGQHEILLLGMKGKVSPPLPENRFSSVINEQRGQHSKKPVVVYEMIEKMLPGRKYLEMFAREQRKNWTVWGNEV